MTKQQPDVAVIMGSDSDLPVMTGAIEALRELGIAHEVRIVSAHRTPEAMLDFGREAASRGLKVIIAGAGGAAHLPGMIASVTSLPVIGVPVAITSLMRCSRSSRCRRAYPSPLSQSTTPATPVCWRRAFWASEMRTFACSSMINEPRPQRLWSRMTKKPGSDSASNPRLEDQSPGALTVSAPR